MLSIFAAPDRALSYPSTQFDLPNSIPLSRMASWMRHPLQSLGLGFTPQLQAVTLHQESPLCSQCETQLTYRFHKHL